MQIQDPKTGIVAAVTSAQQLKVVAESHSLQHDTSRNAGQTYQVLSVDTGITAKTQTGLHIINNDPVRLCVISYIRMQSVTSPSHPLVGDYFEMGFGRTVSSGGTATTPVNTNARSGNVAAVTCTGIDPTMAGTFTAIDRRYIQSDGEEHTYSKEGSIILGLNDTFEIRYVCSGTGEAKYRITFMMIEDA